VIVSYSRDRELLRRKPRSRCRNLMVRQSIPMGETSRSGPGSGFWTATPRWPCRHKVPLGVAPAEAARRGPSSAPAFSGTDEVGGGFSVQAVHNVCHPELDLTGSRLANPLDQVVNDRNLNLGSCLSG
jgi:hypothetical protein